MVEKVIKMRCEIPEVTRCCFCFPLRLGLLVWAYIKLISNLLLFTLILFTTIDDWSRYGDRVPTTIFVFHIPILLTLLLDIIFHIIFIISAHKKDHSKMRIFYRYNIFALVVYILGFVITMSLFFIETYFIYAVIFGLFQLGIFMWIIIIQFYVLILVRSEVIKLERNTNFEFVNHAADPDTLKVDIKNMEGLGY